MQNYGVNDFNVSSLKGQLLFLSETTTFYSLDSRMQLSEMIALFKKLDTIKRMLVVEVTKLLKFILVMPVTNSVSERPFSFLERIKLIFAQQQQING